jgi:hypothetical protein
MCHVFKGRTYREKRYPSPIWNAADRPAAIIVVAPHGSRSSGAIMCFTFRHCWLSPFLRAWQILYHLMSPKEKRNHLQVWCHLYLRASGLTGRGGFRKRHNAEYPGRSEWLYAITFIFCHVDAYALSNMHVRVTAHGVAWQDNFQITCSSTVFTIAISSAVYGNLDRRDLRALEFRVHFFMPVDKAALVCVHLASLFTIAKT